MQKGTMTSGIRRLFCLILCLGVLLGATTACLQTSDYSTHTSSKYHMAFDYPADWSVEDVGDSLVINKSPVGWGGVLLFDELPYSVPTGLPPDETLQLFLQQLTIPHLVAETPIETFQLSAYPAARKTISTLDIIEMPPELATFPTRIATSPRESVFILVQEDDQQALIVAWQIEGRDRKLARQIDAIVESFRFAD